MKMVETLTSKKGLVLYYSATGNTKSILPLFDESKFDVLDIKKNQDIQFNNYEVIIFGTSTWGRGIPPKPFFKIKDELASLRGRKVGLFGSGRTEYEFFCGALDLLEVITQDRNKILFKYKFEGYPRDIDFNEMRKLINKTEELLYENYKIRETGMQSMQNG